MRMTPHDTRKSVTFSLSIPIWTRYRDVCRQLHLTPSEEVEAFMLQRLKELRLQELRSTPQETDHA